MQRPYALKEASSAGFFYPCFTLAKRLHAVCSSKGTTRTTVPFDVKFCDFCVWGKSMGIAFAKRFVRGMTLAATAFLVYSSAHGGAHEGHHPHEQKKAAAPAHCEDTSEADKATVTRLRPLAAVGDRNAQYELGFMYERGRGVQQNYAEAASWFSKAAKQGHPGAQFNLGQMYDIGKGVPQSYTEAASWYRKAAEQGETLAQIHLGFLYEYGQGVAVDMVEAYKWYSLAALTSNEIAPKIKKAAEAKMTQEQIKEGQELANAQSPQQHSHN